jgi:hypothetical protein
MNIVFKYYSLLIFALFSLPVLAVDCGKITFIGDQELLSNHQLMLAWNSSSFKVKNESANKEGLGQYKMLSKKYLFSLKEIGSKNFADKHNNTFQIEVKNNFNYILKVMANESIVEVKLIDKKKIECMSNTANEAKKDFSHLINNRPHFLPEYLKTKVNYFMAKLDNYSNENKINKEGVIVYQGETNQLGIITDKSYQGRQQNIKILTITPFSLANQLGLMSGDIIMQLGESKHVGNLNLITQYIASLSKDEKISIKVERDLKEIMLFTPKKSLMYKKNIFSMTYKLIADTNSEK